MGGRLELETIWSGTSKLPHFRVQVTGTGESIITGICWIWSTWEISHLYHLVNYLTYCSHGKSPFLIGKPSISMGHLYHGYVSQNQRVDDLLFENRDFRLPLSLWGSTMFHVFAANWCVKIVHVTWVQTTQIGSPWKLAIKNWPLMFVSVQNQNNADYGCEMTLLCILYAFFCSLR